MLSTARRLKYNLCQTMTIKVCYRRHLDETHPVSCIKPTHHLDDHVDTVV